MKKKIFLIVLMVALFVVALAFSVSAENNLIKLDTEPTFEQIRANPSKYVSHLEAFDNNSFYAEDPNSVVVLSDQQEKPTYYVFPASYVITSASYTLSFEELNAAIATIDQTAFASYEENDGRGGTIYMIRIEVPTYVTSFGYDKFEKNTNVKEVYFPTKKVVDEETGVEKEVTYFSKFAQEDFFNGAVSLEHIYNIDKVPTTSYTKAMFASCSSLQEITLLNGLTGIPDSCFSGCKSLTEIEIPATVKSVGQKAFYECSGLTEIILPNGVTSVGKLAFSKCTNLETLNFGESFQTFARVNIDYETTTSCTSLKYVYIPSGFLTAVSKATAGDYKHIFNISSAKITFFFTGTEDEAEEIKTLMATTNNNPNLANATLEKYDSTVDYTDYASKKGSNVLIWGYSKCDAFYSSNHIGEKKMVYGENMYFENANICTVCTRCNDTAVEKTLSPLFKSLGYSYSSNAIMQGFGVNYDVLAEYKAFYEGNEISFGLIAVAFANAEDGKLLDAEKKAQVDLTNKEYDIFEMKITGIGSENQATSLFLCGYITLGDKTYYLSVGKCNESALDFATSYESVSASGATKIE